MGQRLFSRKIVQFMSCSKFLLRFNTESTPFSSSDSHHYKRRVICQSNKSHFVSHRKAFYEAYSRTRHTVERGKWSDDSYRTRSRLTHASNLEKYLFSLNYLARVIRWLISLCRGPDHICLLTSPRDFWFVVSRCLLI